MGTTYLDPSGSQIGKKESIADTARVLSRYLDGIMIRTFGHDRVEELAKWADIPVINALTDLLHPCQVLTDLLTIREHKGKELQGLKMAYVGDGNNMTNSYMYGCAKVGMTFVAATPEDYRPDEIVMKNAIADAKATGASITLVTDPKEAVKDADIIVTDTWASMGQEDEHDARKKIFAPYQVNQELLNGADKRAIVMHCLPAFHNTETTVGQQIKDEFGLDCMEVTEEVFESPASIVFDQAENRMHTIKAVMAATLGHQK